MSAKKKLNILFYYYPSMWLNNGGLQNQILFTKEALEKLGHNVYLFEEWIISKDKYKIDIYHQFSCHYSILNLFNQFIKNDTPVIISSVFNNDKSFQNKLASKLDDIGIPILFHKATKTMQKKADYIISLGNSESKDIMQYSSRTKKIIEIPNGVSNSILNFDNSKIIKEDYIVCVGIINKTKNQLRLIKVCKKNNYKLILIGPDSVQEKMYVNACKALGNQFVEFLGYMDNNSKEFMNIVAKAKLFVLPSLNEVLPISVFEALMLGTPVVSTKNSSLGTYLTEKDGCLLCDPNSEKSITNAISKMYGKHIDKELIAEFKSNYTWHNVAEQVQEVYYKTLNSTTK